MSTLTSWCVWVLQQARTHHVGVVIAAQILTRRLGLIGALVVVGGSSDHRRCGRVAALDNGCGSLGGGGGGGDGRPQKLRTRRRSEGGAEGGHVGGGGGRRVERGANGGQGERESE